MGIFQPSNKQASEQAAIKPSYLMHDIEGHQAAISQELTHFSDSLALFIGSPLIIAAVAAGEHIGYDSSFTRLAVGGIGLIACMTTAASSLGIINSRLALRGESQELVTAQHQLAHTGLVLPE